MQTFCQWKKKKKKCKHIANSAIECRISLLSGNGKTYISIIKMVFISMDSNMEIKKNYMKILFVYDFATRKNK